MVQTPVYMDNHSTTRVDPRVVEAILPFFLSEYGNAGSTSHTFGWDAKEAVEGARNTSCGTVRSFGQNVRPGTLIRLPTRSASALESFMLLFQRPSRNVVRLGVADLLRLFPSRFFPLPHGEAEADVLKPMC